MSQHLQYKLEPWFEPLSRKKLSTRTIHSILAIGGRGSSPRSQWTLLIPSNLMTKKLNQSRSYETASYREDDSFQEAVSAEVWIVEHPAIRQTFVNWKRFSTINLTKRRKGKVDLDILLQTFLFDRFLQFEMMRSSVGNNEDYSVFGHFVQGVVYSWVMSALTIFP